MNINIRIGDFGLRWGDYNNMHEFVVYNSEGDTHYVIAFFEEHKEGYDMRTVSDRFFAHDGAWAVGGVFMETLNRFKLIKDEMVLVSVQEYDRLREALRCIENTPPASIDNQVAASVRWWKRLVTDMRDQARAALQG